MTSDTAKPETKPQVKPETFRSHLPAIVAATTGTVLAAVLGSLIGTAGTIAGMAIGGLAAGTCSWWAERAIRRSAGLAAARADAIRLRGRPPHPGEDSAATRATAVVVTRRSAGQHGRSSRRRRWVGPAAFIVTAFIGCAIVVTLLEGAAGKPLSAVVQGKPGHGTTLGGGAVGKAAPARPSSTPSGSPSPTPSRSPSRTPSASATGTGATTPATSSAPPASTAPAATAPSSTGPDSPTPSSTAPSATPSDTAARR